MKLIGLTPSVSATQTYINTAYLRAFTRPGVCPITLPQFTIENRETMDQAEFEALHAERLDALTEACAALCISGGNDISPTTFGEANYASFACDTERDMIEIALIHRFMAVDKPILGICRGHQLAGLTLGLGHFHQDLAMTGEAHSGSSEPYSFKARQEPMHVCDVFGGLRDYLREQTGRAALDSARLCSMHHQGFTLGSTGKHPKFKLAEGDDYQGVFNQWRATRIAAYEETYDVTILAATPLVIEGFERESAKVVSYQSHPEESGPTGLLIQYWLSKYVL